MNVMLRTILTLLVFSRASAFASVEPVSQSQQEKEQTQSQINPKLFKHSLSGLYGISSIKHDVSQPYSDFDALYNQALKAQLELETICKSTALLTNSHAISVGVKSRQRAETKIKTDLANNVNQITDLARATIVSDDIESLVSTFELLEKQANIISVKNRFKKPAPSGYRDLNILVELPETKIIAEVQLHLAEIAKVKSGPEHDLYKQIQDIERSALSSNRAISEIENAKIEGLRRQSLDLYHYAWQPYITTNIKAA
ncbi:RelA/SpoT domain-containing protein [Vibrio sp. DW001]|uniref:RelA/SpoT domain-containing protein n=1 Tax=Vibrio sp. DW001 TaxID=2912315 RepID=UPI0023AFE775|nr:RelA/SpoT domain-containing protein [Vibrio sp. DW001]WED28175.1 RelA/SpoT domain-containing protein [Vibrio sp. DW001]